MFCQSSWAVAKVTLRGKKCKAINCFIIQQGRIKINELNLCFKSLANEQQNKSKENWIKKSVDKKKKMIDLRKKHSINV